MSRPPFEAFTGATCKGSYAFGSACGHCERCAWERATMNVVQGKIISETFQWKSGDPLPISPVDGYSYSVEELTELVDNVATFIRK